MENTPTLIQYITAAAALFAALLSGIGFFVQKRISWQRSVEQIAVFRQNWINELREAMAQFHAIAMASENSPHLREDFYRAGTKIELLLNVDDEDYQAVEDLLYKYLHAAIETHDEVDTAAKLQTFYSLNAEFVEVCQRILKREWNRLKEDIKAQRI